MINPTHFQSAGTFKNSSSWCVLIVAFLPISFGYFHSMIVTWNVNGNRYLCSQKLEYFSPWLCCNLWTMWKTLSFTAHQSLSECFFSPSYCPILTLYQVSLGHTTRAYNLTHKSLNNRPKNQKMEDAMFEHHLNCIALCWSSGGTTFARLDISLSFINDDFSTVECWRWCAMMLNFLLTFLWTMIAIWRPPTYLSIWLDFSSESWLQVMARKLISTKHFVYEIKQYLRPRF